MFSKLISAQSELKCNKGQYNSFGGYSYRSCEDILEAAKPIMRKYKLLLNINDEVVQIGDRYYVKAVATIYDAESDKSISSVAYAREPSEKTKMDAAQITGTASSYARKYALNGLFLIDDTKDADTDEYRNQQDGKQEEKPTPAEMVEYLKNSKCANCGNVIVEYNGKDGKRVSIKRHADACRKQFGEVLCLDCIKERTNAESAN